MICPNCKKNSIVTDSRMSDGVRYRRRECACEKRWTTMETIFDGPLPFKRIRKRKHKTYVRKHKTLDREHTTLDSGAKVSTEIKPKNPVWSPPKNTAAWAQALLSRL